MANAVQTIAPVGIMKTFGTILKEPLRFKSSEPMGIINFVADSDVVTAIGSGDTATLKIRQDLPVGFLYRFKDMFVALKGTAVGGWLTAGKFTFNYGVDTAVSISAELNYPLSRALSSLVNGSHVMYQFGGFADGDDVGPLAFPAPTWLINGRGPADTTNPTFQIQNNTASVGPWVVGYLFRYDVFPIEQGENSGLYWSYPVKEM